MAFVFEQKYTDFYQSKIGVKNLYYFFSQIVARSRPSYAVHKLVPISDPGWQIRGPVVTRENIHFSCRKRFDKFVPSDFRQFLTEKQIFCRKFRRTKSSSISSFINLFTLAGYHSVRFHVLAVDQRGWLIL